mmetsp:Transcript_38089/g.93602  ORF Transcript_38089/g.93602 Transcript_38089/m.93602 type:complete len:450 (+) Transcript_38089:583-1932(+)
MAVHQEQRPLTIPLHRQVGDVDECVPPHRIPVRRLFERACLQDHPRRHLPQACETLPPPLIAMSLDCERAVRLLPLGKCRVYPGWRRQCQHPVEELRPTILPVRGDHESEGVGRASPLPHQRDGVGVAAEGLDVPLDPLERHGHVQQPVVARHPVVRLLGELLEGQEAESTEAVVDRYGYKAPLCNSREVIAAPRSRDVAAAVYEEDDGKKGLCSLGSLCRVDVGGIDVEEEAILALVLPVREQRVLLLRADSAEAVGNLEATPAASEGNAVHGSARRHGRPPTPFTSRRQGVGDALENAHAPRLHPSHVPARRRHGTRKGQRPVVGMGCWGWGWDWGWCSGVRGRGVHALGVESELLEEVGDCFLVQAVCLPVCLVLVVTLMLLEPPKLPAQLSLDLCSVLPPQNTHVVRQLFLITLASRELAQSSHSRRLVRHLHCRGRHSACLPRR